MTAWIDTAFNGDLVLPRDLIQRLNLQPVSVTEVKLGDGNTVSLMSYVCHVEWFNEQRSVEVIANDGEMPLLGTGLLANRVLQVDYQQGTVNLD